MRHPDFVVGLIILALLLLTTSVLATSVPSPISPVLGQPNSSKSFDDSSFKERAAYAVYNLTSPMPTDNKLMELKSLYYEIVKKNISPDYYSQAKDTAKYLFYVLKTAEEYQDFKEHISAGGNSVKFYDEIHEQAILDLAAAKDTWPNISAFYPNATVISTD